MGESKQILTQQSKAMILGCSGLRLTESEAVFFQQQRPFGFILFSRNIDNSDQLRALTGELCACVDHPIVPILIDQEGGRVQRLRPPLVDNYPHAWQLGKIYQQDKDAGLQAAWLMSRLHAFDLLKLGINVNCLPVLDIPTPQGHEVVGKRAYGDELDIVAAMGRAAIDGLKAGGVLPVIKHIPGHGRARVDTHLELSEVDASLDALMRTDFQPFTRLSGELMAMTAHVIYSAIDPKAPATMSAKVIGEYIRGKIGFDGLLMSDDISMNALSGDFSDRAAKIFTAGCDIVLHCNGDMAEMQEIAKFTPVFKEASLRRAEAVLASFSEPDDHDESSLRLEFKTIMDRYNA